MRIGFLLFGILALTVGVNGQTGVQTTQPDATWKTGSLAITSENQRLSDGRVQVYTRLTAEGVEIRIGNSILVADQAEVTNWAGSTGPTEIKLRGNVRLTTVLDVRQK